MPVMGNPMPIVRPNPNPLCDGGCLRRIGIGEGFRVAGLEGLYCVHCYDHLTTLTLKPKEPTKKPFKHEPYESCYCIYAGFKMCVRPKDH